ncbi:MAG: hypothetical protein N2596_03315, partial [Syntrophorhabdaceae bacterium]|nr:hypothetical protein [Syntrophorhabdaceae bacterium]
MSPDAEKNPKNIVEDVLGRAMTKEIWSGSYDKVLPVTIQNFDLPSILPAVFYMFRFGFRRGKGKFLETFGARDINTPQGKRVATIENVAERLSQTDYFEGFNDSVEKAILGDLLLSFCLENKNKALGRNEQIQRVAPAHFFSSWVDLP